ncbi:hypothetical protein HWV62_45635 [Athelia sp. TMB]|nr:hypothetical protein HWV62_45635 [Athelia sp. TMB]
MPTFTSLSIRSTIIRPLVKDFVDYLHSDGVMVPEGSEDLMIRAGFSPAESTLSDDEDEDQEDEDEEEVRRYAFPELDAKIRRVIKDYGAVFPKLNFSSPKDASWVLLASSPLKCLCPADVYLLLKSSDFISHDLSEETVFEGCEPPRADSDPPYALELVLRKWYPVDRSREFRCFVRQDSLLGISQRDTNYYDFLNEPQTCRKITTAIKEFWETHIHGKWASGGDYTFDILLTRDLSRGHIVDFNVYSSRTDPLLFTYDELLAILVQGRSSAPQLKVIDSRTHPAATRNAPAHQHNMIPFEALNLSSGRDIEQFGGLLQEEIEKTLAD